MLRDLASRCRYLGQERCFSVRNRSSFVCFIHISSFSFTDIGRCLFIWNNLSDKTVEKKLFWYTHQCFMMYTATLLDQQVRCFKLVGRRHVSPRGVWSDHELRALRCASREKPSTKTLQKPANWHRQVHHPHHKKTRKKNNRTTKKQVPHPHQPLLLVEKGEKAIEKYLTESNCRNGKQITDHIRHNFGKRPRKI